MSAAGVPVLHEVADLAARQRRFHEATTLRQSPAPAWCTPNEVVFEAPGFRLRRFASPDAAGPGPDPVPLLIVPPEVNQSYIVDFAPDQSLVRAAHRGGFRQVAALDWQSAGEAAARRDIDHSVADILRCIDLLGGRVHLVGVCQGGWESAIAAALRPGALATLTLVAAPIDFDAGQGPVKHLARMLPMGLYRQLVTLGGGVMRGGLISGGFDSLQPLDRFALKPLTVWNHLDDPAWMDRFQRLNDWYRSPKDLPGPLYLRAVRELFKQNRLIQGRLVVMGEPVRLARIDCPLCLVAGRRDHITPPPQLEAARYAVSSRAVRMVLTEGGHIGTFMGRAELETHWPGIFAWLQDSSRAD